ncbi:MAG: YqiJ family protein [Desulfosarcinaceae bacterium]
MITFLLSSQNLPFTVALTLMLAIAVMEGVSTLIGAGFSDMIDSVLPEMDLDVDADIDVDADMDLDTDFHAPGPFTRLFSWLRVGQVPVLILAIVFLTAFGLIGLFCQSTAIRLFGHLLPASLASIPALVITFPVVRISGGVLAKVLPKDETESVSEESFVGRVAVITLGKAEVGKPAQGRLTDPHGQSHYLMVEPDQDGVRFEQGTEVLIVSHQGAIYKGIENPNKAVTD